MSYTKDATRYRDGIEEETIQDMERKEKAKKPQSTTQI